MIRPPEQSPARLRDSKCRRRVKTPNSLATECASSIPRRKQIERPDVAKNRLPDGWLNCPTCWFAAVEQKPDLRASAKNAFKPNGKIHEVLKLVDIKMPGAPPIGGQGRPAKGCIDNFRHQKTPERAGHLLGQQTGREIGQQESCLR